VILIQKRETCIECGTNIRDSTSRYRCAGCRTWFKISHNGFTPQKKNDRLVIKDGKVISGKMMPCKPGRRYRGGLTEQAKKARAGRNVTKRWPY